MGAEVNSLARALQTHDDSARFGLSRRRAALMQVVLCVQYCRESGNRPPDFGKKPVRTGRHSHSIVPGGFDVMS
jgi:hypothetical protein